MPPKSPTTRNVIDKETGKKYSVDSRKGKQILKQRKEAREKKKPSAKACKPINGVRRIRTPKTDRCVYPHTRVGLETRLAQTERKLRELKAAHRAKSSPAAKKPAAKKKPTVKDLKVKTKQETPRARAKKAVQAEQVSKAVATGRLKACIYEKEGKHKGERGVWNAKTNQCVLATGTVGRQLLSETGRAVANLSLITQKLSELGDQAKKLEESVKFIGTTVPGKASEVQTVVLEDGRTQYTYASHNIFVTKENDFKYELTDGDTNVKSLKELALDLQDENFVKLLQYVFKKLEVGDNTFTLEMPTVTNSEYDNKGTAKIIVKVVKQSQNAPNYDETVKQLVENDMTKQPPKVADSAAMYVSKDNNYLAVIPTKLDTQDIAAYKNIKTFNSVREELSMEQYIAWWATIGDIMEDNFGKPLTDKSLKFYTAQSPEYPWVRMYIESVPTESKKTSVLA